MTVTTRRRRSRLDTVLRRLDRWRRARPHARAPVPPRLLAAAVALVAEHGVYRTARALHLDYGTLKRHVDRGAGPVRVHARPRCIELPPAPVAAEAVIELERPGGATVRVRLPGRTLAEIADFTQQVASSTS
jgi:hypothetical protein